MTNTEIFPATEISAEVLRWRSLNIEGKSEESMVSLDAILVLITPMLERLAQYEGYHHTVPLDVLKSSAYSKVIKWIQGWDESKSIFTWFSKCARNVFISEVSKESQRRDRFQSVGESLEKYFGSEDHASDTENLTEEVDTKIKGLTCRWGSEQERAAIRFILECVVENNYNKSRIIKGASFAFAITNEMAKFFYWWVIVNLRDINYERLRKSYSDTDFLYAWLSYNPTIEILDYIPLQMFRKFVTVFGGTRIRVPTLAQIEKLSLNRKLVEEVDKSGMTPQEIDSIAAKYKRSSKSLMDTYREIIEIYNENRLGEYNIYE